ncbi:MAG TPA: pseudouridine synthase [Gaiellales bacterium]|nr:pseudouridine synthase [Gaiellales bacterium]
MPVRVNRYLASTGLGSRRAVEEVIRAGRVTVNGAVADLATRVEEGDDVRVDGEPVRPEAVVAVLLNKPRGVVTTASDPQGRPTVTGLVSVDARLFPVGRLDRDTTGVLILTNDGALADHLMHPRHGVAKTYRARVRGEPAEADLDRLRAGVELDDGPTAPAAVQYRGSSVVEITIHEGRNRQVRRMCAAIGHPVIHLHRTAYAGLTAERLEPGEWRELTAAEVAELRDA